MNGTKPGRTRLGLQARIHTDVDAKNLPLAVVVSNWRFGGNQYLSGIKARRRW